MAEKTAAGSPRRAQGAVLEEILTEIGRGRGPEDRPTKDDLLNYLNAGAPRLNLYLLRHLAPEQIALFRKSQEFQARLTDSLRQTVVGLKPPLLIPQRVRLMKETGDHSPLTEVRKDPDLWAGRLLARLPLAVDIPPLLALRDLQARLHASLEARLGEFAKLEDMDRVFGYIEHELGGTPSLEAFVRRALALSHGIRDIGEVTAFYRLMAGRVLRLLERLPASVEKDRVLLVFREEAGTMDLEALRLEFRRRAMAIADSLMKETGKYDDLVELRFFFDQIGERANAKLLSKKTGEIARKLDFKSQGYRVLSSLDAGELDDDGLIEVVPVLLARSEQFVMGAPLRFLNLLLGFYLGTAVPLLRRMKSQPEKVPRLIQNFKRRVGLLNIYRDLDHLAEVLQRKMVLSICNPGMLAEHPDKIMGYLTRLPPEFFPPAVMKALRRMIREHGTEYIFRPMDVLTLLAFYPPPESDEETGPVKPQPGQAKGQ